MNLKDLRGWGWHSLVEAFSFSRRSTRRLLNGTYTLTRLCLSYPDG